MISLSNNTTSIELSFITAFNVSIPNTFTPNYDGLNDIFIPVFTSYGFDQRSYLLEIFDRWGELIFKSDDKSINEYGLVKTSKITLFVLAIS